MKTTTKMEGFVLFLVAAAAVSIGMTNLAMSMGHQEKSSSYHVSAMYMLGDSSVDCGANTLFYPFFHQHLSLFPCNGSNSHLLPYLLGNTHFSSVLLISAVTIVNVSWFLFLENFMLCNWFFEEF